MKPCSYLQPDLNPNLRSITWGTGLSYKASANLPGVSWEFEGVSSKVFAVVWDGAWEDSGLPMLVVPAEGGWDGIDWGPGTIVVSVTTVVSDLGDRTAGSVGNSKTEHKYLD